MNLGGRITWALVYGAASLLVGATGCGGGQPSATGTGGMAAGTTSSGTMSGTTSSITTSSSSSGAGGAAGCPTGLTSCMGACVQTKYDPTNCGACGKTCAATEVCSAGTCQSVCGAGLEQCGMGCVDTGNDPNNCGACGKACAAGEFCSMGACKSDCGQLTACSGICVDTSTNPNNCGACDKACAKGGSCSGGNCLPPPCAPGQTTCGGGLSEYCAKIATDPQNCGGCGYACPSGQVCSEGHCGPTCTGKTSTPCNGTCVDTDSDNQNCGMCGNACPAGQVCSGGACGVTCAPSYGTCGTAPSAYCADERDDPENCGGCGQVCPSGEYCSNGTCSGSCAGVSSALCNGLCVDVLSDPKNCGACSNACAAGQVCSNGQCAASCTAGYTSCGTSPHTSCANTQTDPNNCGACGTVCAASQVCSQGVCSTACAGLKSTSCNGTCVNIATDPGNCGACGRACGGATPLCAEGTCVAACASPLFQCGVGASAVCVDFSDDPSNCGGCGVVCPAGQVCSNSQCSAACSAGFTSCGTGAVPFCTKIASDPSNCGACGHACAPPENGHVSSCSNGACGFSCDPGYAALNQNNLCVPLTGVAVGINHGCGITPSGGVMCWGHNADGELGDGTTTNRLVPTPVLGLPGNNPAVSLTIGYWHTCALLQSGAVYCWGYNSKGQLGDGTTTTRTQAVPVMGFASSGASAVSAGGDAGTNQADYSYTCAIRSSNGSIVCWGSGLYGNLGTGSTMDQLTPSTPVAGITGATSLGAGFNISACAVAGGQVYCWGYNGASGQLGVTGMTQSNVPVMPLGLPASVTSVGVGFQHACALTNMGAVVCWGANTYGQLGNGTLTSNYQYQSVTGLNQGVSSLHVSNNFNCAVTGTNAILCWGANDVGEFGNGMSQLNNPTPVPGPSFTGGYSIDVRGGSGCAVTAAGPTLCWGWDNSGQLGDGDASLKNQLSPVPIQ